MGEIMDMLMERNHWRDAYAQAIAERDQAVNCIYEVRQALSSGDPGKAMEVVIGYELNLDHKEK